LDGGGGGVGANLTQEQQKQHSLTTMTATATTDDNSEMLTDAVLQQPSPKKRARSAITVSTASDLHQIVTHSQNLWSKYNAIAKEHNSSVNWITVAKELGIHVKVREKYARMHSRAKQRNFDFLANGHWKIKDHPTIFLEPTNAERKAKMPPPLPPGINVTSKTDSTTINIANNNNNNNNNRAPTTIAEVVTTPTAAASTATTMAAVTTNLPGVSVTCVHPAASTAAAAILEQYQSQSQHIDAAVEAAVTAAAVVDGIILSSTTATMMPTSSGATITTNTAGAITTTDVSTATASTGSLLKVLEV